MIFCVHVYKCSGNQLLSYTSLLYLQAQHPKHFYYSSHLSQLQWIHIFSINLSWNEWEFKNSSIKLWFGWHSVCSLAASNICSKYSPCPIQERHSLIRLSYNARLAFLTDGYEIMCKEHFFKNSILFRKLTHHLSIDMLMVTFN